MICLISYKNGYSLLHFPVLHHSFQHVFNVNQINNDLCETKLPEAEIKLLPNGIQFDPLSRLFNPKEFIFYPDEFIITTKKLFYHH